MTLRLFGFDLPKCAFAPPQAEFSGADHDTSLSVINGRS
jgi:hypothetical protein